MYCTLLMYLLAQAAAPEVPKDPKLYLYDAKRDSAGQKLEAAAGAIANGAIFETQLENLKVVSQREMDRIFASQRRAALAGVEGARTWASMMPFLQAAKVKMLPEEAKAKWEDEQKRLSEQLAAIPKPAAAEANAAQAPSEFLLEFGRSQEIRQAASFLASKKIASRNDLRVLKRMQEGVAAIGKNLTDLAAMPVAASTRTAQQRMKISLIQAEMDYWRAVGLIEARRQMGQDEANKLFIQFEDILDSSKSPFQLKFSNDDGEVVGTDPLSPSESIEETLRKCQSDPVKLGHVVLLLQVFAAINARALTHERIAQLRLAVEDRRFEIRKDAIFARTYEEVFLLGAQRLALYGKGGIKPEALAAFLQAAMTAGLIPAVSLR